MSFSTNQIARGFQIELIDLPELDHLQQEWRALEPLSEGSFFTSWTWIGAWLESLPKTIQPMLLRATRHGQVLGLGILVSSIQRKAKLIPIRTWYLHETGRPELDNITIEYNGFLLNHEVREELEPLMQDYLLRETKQWDELQFNALSRPPVQSKPQSQHQQTRYHTREHSDIKVAYQVPLTSVRTDGPYVDLIKPKPRYHIKRSIQAYETWGPIRVIEATTKAQAFTYLHELKRLHREYWHLKGEPGAFSDEFFNQFHDRLIDEGYERGEIQMLAIQAGDRAIGYLYNFVWRGHVYNYQSGIDYKTMGGRNSPGMVCHALAISHNAVKGYQTYDLMAGDHQYKRALTLQTVPLAWHKTRRINMCTSLEDGLRAMATRTASIAHIGTVGSHMPEWVCAPPISILA